ncbi:MAG TPA: ATP-binding protein [Armatimonadota bacterium]|nr:ATP-binding protein [Armatimonadota bacterium]
MQVSTLRRRLSLRYLGLLAITFSLLGVGVYQGLVWGLRRDFDAGLLAAGNNGARAIVAAIDRYNTDRAASPDLVKENVEQSVLEDALLTSTRYAQLVSDQGIEASTPVLKTAPLPTPREPVLSALSGKPAFATLTTGGPQKLETYSPGQEQLRAVFYPVSANGHRYVLEVATPILGVTEALAKVSLILFVVTPILLLIAAAAGSWMINGVLARVDDMARTARRIGAQNLNERLPERGPDEIGQLGETFNEMLDRLSLAFDRMRQFTADASHELKTPLTSIRGDAEVGLMRQRSAAEYREILERVVEESERMSEIVESLLLLARADDHSVPIRLELVEAGDLVDEVTAGCQTAAERAGVRLEHQSPPGLVMRGDAVFLRQMLGNLVENAIKYTPAGGRVAVRAKGDRDQVILEVEDNGPGIAPEHRTHIFDRFYRVDSSHSSSTGGSGLGLSIARAIALEHGGAIGVEDSPGGGCLFSVTLPAASLEEDEESPAPNAGVLELLL